jgi:hypothetical protein
MGKGRKGEREKGRRGEGGIMRVWKGIIDVN